MTTTHPYFQQRRLGDAFGASIGGAVNDVFRGPVIPPLTGMQYAKIFLVALGAAYILKQVGFAFRGGGH